MNQYDIIRDAVTTIQGHNVFVKEQVCISLRAIEDNLYSLGDTPRNNQIQKVISLEIAKIMNLL